MDGSIYISSLQLPLIGKDIPMDRVVNAHVSKYLVIYTLLAMKLLLIFQKSYALVVVLQKQLYVFLSQFVVRIKGLLIHSGFCIRL